MTGRSDSTLVVPQRALADLWQHAGYSAAALACVRLTGDEPALPSSFAIGTLAQVGIAATALAAAQFWQLRGGRSQSVAVDMRHAAAELAQRHPGIVAVSLSAYGHRGPWSQRRGFDSLVQTASGFNHAEMLAAGSAEPKALPAQALDHAAGYLLTLGAITALHRRSIEGGSWQVRVSLARTGLWLRSLGRVENGFAMQDQQREDITDLLEETDSEFGRLSTVKHAVQLALTPACYARTPVRLGGDPARWSP